jgi:hypothetical protein
MLVRWLLLLQLPRYTMFPSSHSPTQMCEKFVSLWVVGQWVQYGLAGLRGGSTLAPRSRISQFSPPDRSRPNPWEEYTKPASVATAARISRSHATVLGKDVTTAATKRASPSRPSGRRRIPSTPRKSSADSRAASAARKIRLDRSTEPCLGEFEQTAPNQKYCNVCAMRQKALMADNANAADNAEPEKLAKRPRQISGSGRRLLACHFVASDTCIHASIATETANAAKAANPDTS